MRNKITRGDYMLNIYTNKKFIPAELTYIFDNDKFFTNIEVKDTEVNRIILSKIDKAEYMAADMFTDRLGRGIYIDYLSMSSKILLNVANSDNSYVFNCVEMGRNAFELLFELDLNGNICFPNGLFYDIPEWADMGKIMFNGKTVESLDELED
jgi:hypothetical protein